MSKQIELSNGGFAIVDDVDYEYLNQWKWNRHTMGYARRSTIVNNKYVTILMHRAIMNPKGDEETHHINENKLDNQRNNLVLIKGKTHKQKHVKKLVEYQKKHQKYPDYKHCAECGKIFQVNPRKRKRHKTCSKECAQKMRVRGMMKGRGVW